MEVVEAKILTNPHKESPNPHKAPHKEIHQTPRKTLNKLSDKSPHVLPTNPTIKKESFSYEKGNLLLFLTMRVQCKIARKDEKYLQDYCVRIA
ncbi:hypothetical protein ACT7C2_19465 [Bacillus pacificus]